MTDSSSATAAETSATFIELAIHCSTGNAGASHLHIGFEITDMPSASFQWSSVSALGIRLPPAKLPGRSEIDRIISSGSIVSTMNTSSAACTAITRQRWLAGVTTAIVRLSLSAAGRPRPATLNRRRLATANVATMRNTIDAIAQASA